MPLRPFLAQSSLLRCNSATSASGVKADVDRGLSECPLMTQSRHFICNRYSGQCLLGGKAQRCCLHLAGHPVQYGSSLPHHTAYVPCVGCLLQDVLTLYVGSRVSVSSSLFNDYDESKTPSYAIPLFKTISADGEHSAAT